jgi:hypothetical protein
MLDAFIEDRRLDLLCAWLAATDDCFGLCVTMDLRAAFG